jgi:hypothetical protein
LSGRETPREAALILISYLAGTGMELVRTGLVTVWFRIFESNIAYR